MPEMQANMTTRRIKNLASGAVFAALGLFIVIASQQFEDAGRSTPTFIGYGLIALSLLLIVTEIVRSDLLPIPESDDGSKKQRFLFVVLMGLWILALPYFGFLLSCSVMFIFIALAVPRVDRWTVKGIVLHALSGVMTSATLWFALTQLLNIPLPEASLF